jgi:tetratricopeptide (TPR) repeat protein
MQTNNAMLGGRSAYSVQSAIATMNSIPKDYLSFPDALGNYVQYIYMTPMLVDIRFGRWDVILEQAKPGEAQVYSNILFHFGRGMAFAAKMKTEEAKNELRQLKDLMKEPGLAIPLSPFSAAIEGAIIAENLLAGTIALKEKNYESAIAAFTKAVATEENMVYNEPRDWMLNPKHYLGNAYIQAGKWKEAETTFQNDLKNNNDNGWALYGLYQALNGQNKKTEAGKIMQQFRKAFENSDITLSAAAF